MFPLGTVLVPFAHMPLHIFEPRYRALTRDCLAGDLGFGVVLIERGSEVGGGDVRFDVGTLARITQAVELPDGRYVLDTVGTQRFRIRAWLPDDPYPLAEVETIVEDEPGPEALARRDQVFRLLRQVLALQVELGFPAPAATTELDSDPCRASFEAAALAPLGPFDTQQLLEDDSTEARLCRLVTLLEEALEVLRARLTQE